LRFAKLLKWDLLIYIRYGNHSVCGRMSVHSCLCVYQVHLTEWNYVMEVIFSNYTLLKEKIFQL